MKNKCMFNDKIVLSKTKSIMLSHDYLIIKDYLEVTWGRYSLKNPNDQAPQSFGQRKNFILLSHWVPEHSIFLSFKYHKVK